MNNGSFQNPGPGMFSSPRAESVTPGGIVIPPLSRRKFLSIAAMLGASGHALGTETDPGRTMNNTGYQTPLPAGGPLRNPDAPAIELPAKTEGITFTKLPVVEPWVALTFDDGPHPQNTPRLLDMLRERNVKATFYVIGRSVDAYPAIVRRIVAEGHEIGNHTYTHRVLSKLGDEAVKQELQKTSDSIERASGVRPRTLRPPYGALRQKQREWVHQDLGLPTILWSVDPLDWKRPGPSVVCSRILASTAAGGIILAHDLHGQTVDAMPATVDGLLQKGFRFLTVSQLIAVKPPENREGAHS